MKNEFLKFAKKYGFNSIVVKNSINMFLVFTLITTILMSVLGSFEFRSIQKEAENENAFYARQISNSVEATFRDIEFLCSELFLNEYTLMFLSSGDYNYMKDNYGSLISDTLKVGKTGRKAIDSIYIYSEAINAVCSTDRIYSTEDFGDISWLSEYKKINESSYKIFTRKIDNKYAYAATFIKKSSDGKGAIIVNIDLKKIKENYIDVTNTQSSRFYIIDEDESVLYSNDTEEYNKPYGSIEILKEISEKNDGLYKKNGETLTYHTLTSSYYPWKYIYISPYAEYEKHLQSIYVKIIGIMLFSLFIAIAMSITLSLRSAKDVVGLLDILEKNTDSLPSISENEVNEIANRVIRIIDNNNALKNELQQRISDYENIKIKVLQSQINSHFMNNTLAVINGKVINNEGYNSEASRMIVKLSKILKYSFIVDETFVTLSEELDFIKKYIEMIELRYGKISNPVYLPDELKDFKIPRMCLQVLVENAVFHNKHNNDRAIIISCENERDKVVISVTDNGCGMTAEAIESCRKSFVTDEFKHKNIGLANIYRRIKLIYGDNSDLLIESKENEFTKVSIVISKN